jgi:polar amino acid transport system substrate-binding protein
MTRRVQLAGGVGIVTVVLLGACTWADEPSDALDSLDALPQRAAPSTTSEPPASTTPTTLSATRQACEDGHLATASYRPDPAMVLPDDLPAEIVDRGELRVGVDETTLGFSYRDPTTGDIEGFEVDLAREIAARLLGDAMVDDGVEIVTVAPDEKRDVVRDGEVDMTVSAVTMTCRRWEEEVAFSSEYYSATQQFLVHVGSGIDDVSDLARATVCVTRDSSSEEIMRDHVPEAELVRVANRADCLIALQQGEADAYFGHDSFLYGMAWQDDTVEVVPGLLPDETTVSNYGIAIAHEHPELVRAVNAALEDIRQDGTWARLHADIEGPPLELPTAEPPAPKYRD